MADGKLTHHVKVAVQGFRGRKRKKLNKNIHRKKKKKKKKKKRTNRGRNSFWNVNPFTAPACKISWAEGCTDTPSNSIFSGPITSTFIAVRNYGSPFTCQCEKENRKALRVSNLALLLVVFKWHHGSEGVKPGVKIRNKYLNVLVTGLLFLQPSRVISRRDQLNVRNISAHESIYTRVQSNAECETGK